MKLPRYRFKWQEAITHVIAWVMLFSIPFFLNLQNRYLNEPRRFPREFSRTPRPFIHPHEIIHNLLLIVAFYLNAYVLLPRLAYKKRYGAYVVAQLLTIGLLLFISYLLFEYSFQNPERHRPPFFIPIFPYLLMLTGSITYRMVRDKLREDQLKQEKDYENLKTELSLLRSQVSPHFMFNVLNNIASMARLQSAQLEPTVVKLSGLMRYMLYNSEDDKVNLATEIDYLHSFIDLQKQRFEDTVTIEVAIDVPQNDLMIEPMLLIPFVENAFKHGTGYIENALISISLSTADGVMFFRVVNNFDAASKEIKDQASGIGLANVKRRLELLYGNKHKLEIAHDNKWFSVFLQINLM